MKSLENRDYEIYKMCLDYRSDFLIDKDYKEPNSVGLSDRERKAIYKLMEYTYDVENDVED
jgi:hypothetical protein